MPRRREIAKREVPPDPVYNSALVTKFVNTVMNQGKRSTAERIDAEARIVAERQHARSLGCGVGLEPGVFGKGGAGFLGLGQAELSGGDELETEGSEQLLKFGELAGIVSGQDEPVAFAEAGNGGHLAPPGFSSRARAMSFQMAQSGAGEPASPRP